MTTAPEGATPPEVLRREIPLSGVRLSVLEAGKGPAVLFVHGSVTTSELFRETIEHFSGRYRAVAVDLRGYGASEKPDTGYTIEQFSEDLAELCERINLGKFILVGVSMGGFVAQRFALDHHDRLAGLVLCSTSDGELAPGLIADGDPEKNVRRKGWRKVSEDMITGAFPATTDPAIVRGLLSRIDTWNENVIIGACRSIQSFSTRGKLDRIRVPTLIMVGTEDHQLPVPFSERMLRAIPDSRIEVFDKVGHFMMIEDPARFRASLGAFLDKVHA